MDSPPHRENVMGKYSQAGLAVALDKDGAPYWCVEFGTPWPRLDPAVAAKDVVSQLNKEREKTGLAPLKPHPKLSQAAGRIAKALAKVDSLQNSDGKGPDVADVLKQSGYRYRRVAELAASGHPTADDVSASWLKNENDRKNVLGEFTDVGVGYARTAEDKPFWCLFLARPLRR
jgi:uncharacterized protein YkwD